METADTVDTDGTPSVGASGPVARALVLVVLSCGLVSRVADGIAHESAAYVPFVLVLYAVPFWYASGRGRALLLRHRRTLLVVQAVLTYLPFAIFGDGWVGGASGLLGALVLLLVPGRPGWLLFAGLAVLEPVLWLAVGLPYQPALNAGCWVTIAFLITALSGFALNRLVDLDETLATARSRLVADAVDRQKLAAVEHLRTRIVQRLTSLSEGAGDVVGSTDADRLRSGLVAAGKLAREAAADSRRLLLALPDPTPARLRPTGGPTIVEPRLAYLVTAAVTVLFGLQTVLNVAAPVAEVHHPASAVVVVVLAVLAVVVLTLLHLDLDGSARRPRGWPLTLLLQGVLLAVLYQVAGATALALLGTLAASVLVSSRHPARWAILVAVVAIMPVLTFAHPPGDETTLPREVRWCIYVVAIQLTASLLIYGLSRFTVASLEVERASHKVAALAARQEQARLARDVHDTLGLGLSTIALKTDLAVELLDISPDRARWEAVQIMRLATTVASDAVALGTGAVVLDLRHELASARATLEAAGVRVETDVEVSDGTTHGAAVLAAVLREAVTNVIRHSRARSCVIRLVERGPLVLLEVTNDGAQEAPREPGTGLHNMEERLRPLGGRLTTTGGSDGVYSLAATLPATTTPLVRR